MSDRADWRTVRTDGEAYEIDLADFDSAHVIALSGPLRIRVRHKRRAPVVIYVDSTAEAGAVVEQINGFRSEPPARG